MAYKQQLAVVWKAIIYPVSLLLMAYNFSLHLACKNRIGWIGLLVSTGWSPQDGVTSAQVGSGLNGFVQKSYCHLVRPKEVTVAIQNGTVVA